ncbi:MAG: hypothetical protein COA79_24555 [Planctomycetota bacterium]|nr:MAG: hypothetical protein COA79_24555 [Planctomycetota bacterium]
MNHSIIERIEYLKEWISYNRAYMDNVGASISIFNNKEVLFTDGFGFSNIEKEINASSSSIYRVASITKLFTATAIMQLKELGKLNLNKPVIEYIPWFKFSKELDLDKVTILNLLTHSAGIPRESAHPYWITLNFPDKEGVKEGLKDQRQILPSNKMWKYSNLGFGFLGEIIEIISGYSYEDYIQNNIIKPLGLTNTHIKSIDNSNPQMSIGYSRKLPRQQRVPIKIADCQWIGSAANLSSTALDLAKFLQVFMNNDGSFLNKETINEMLQLNIENKESADGYSLGFKHINLDNHIKIGHSGSFQGFKSYAYFLKELTLGVIVLTSSTDSNPVLIANQIYDCLLPTLNSPSSHYFKGQHLKKFTGKYRNAWRDYCVLLLDGQLNLFNMSEGNFKNNELLIEEGENIFRLESNSGGSSNGEKVSFELNAENIPTRIFIGNSYADAIIKW